MKPRFEFKVERILEDKVDLKELDLYIEFSDRTISELTIDVSDLKYGETKKRTPQGFVFTRTGDTRICLRLEKHLLKGQQFHTLYAFVVSPEATFVFLMLNVILGGLLALLFRL